MPRRISSASSRAAAAHRDQCVKSIPDCPGGANCPHGKGMFTRSFSTRQEQSLRHAFFLNRLNFHETLFSGYLRLLRKMKETC